MKMETKAYTNKEVFEREPDNDPKYFVRVDCIVGESVIVYGWFRYMSDALTMVSNTIANDRFSQSRVFEIVLCGHVHDIYWIAM